MSGETGVGMPGGCSWTKHWLTFDNTYFSRFLQQAPESNDGDKKVSDTTASVSPLSTSEAETEETTKYLLYLPTDLALFNCPEFHPYVVKYA